MTFDLGWILILTLTGLIYMIVLVKVQVGLTRLSRDSRRGKEAVTPGDWPQLNVIIPCRNEAQHIAAALEDLARQTYPPDRWEIIVVDDRSTDGTGEVARLFQDRLPHLTILEVAACPPGVSPKKHALRRGLQQARGEIIVTTDGDCRFAPGWLTSLISHFEDGVGVVAGLTIFHRKQREPFWQRMQQLDYLSHSFLAAGAIQQGWAFNANGSNLAIRRAAMDSVGEYNSIEGVVTGDDTLFLQRLHDQGNWKIKFSVHPDSLVRSYPEETPRAVLNQRLRWGSGGLSYSPPALIFALGTFTFFLMLLISPLLYALSWISVFWLLGFGLKILLDYGVLKTGFRVFRLKPDWLAFIVLEMIHVPAILAFSIGGHLWGFHWKGDRFQRRRRTPLSLSSSEVRP